jgi:membrane protease YdiL (CAAX protease family)
VKVGFVLTLVSASVLVIAGIGLGYIALDIKWPEIIYSWTLLNLIAVLAEEGFYRSFLQRLLTDFNNKILGKYADILALLVTSALFGLSHYKMGFIHASLCSVGGFIFGYGLTKSRRVEACMISHFLLNMAHLIFFTYPNMV